MTRSNARSTAQHAGEPGTGADGRAGAGADVRAMVDWDLAVSLGSRLAGDGPAVTRDEAASVVAELRAGAERSTGLVRDFTGLVAAERTAPVAVVDRPGWIQANADSFATILSPVVERLAAKKGRPGGVALAVGSRVTGAEVGGLLGFLAGKVLGQFDPFFGDAGRLLLVAPNIVHVERELQARPHDFRLWVCLHEETHRVQFTAVPWMRDHLRGEMEKIADTLEPTRLLDDGVKRIGEALRAARSGAGGGGSLIDVLGTPQQKEIVDRVTGVMSLLEGHADVVMDGVGPQVIPSVAAIRRSFDQRRKGVGALDRVLRKLLGLDAKMAQYRNGATFVRGVVAKVGMAEFNAVWDRPENLPTRAEIAEPSAWVSRVL
ncbi:zinc-dependent metalloprotease [Nocardioides panaciterrulae]|uniref:Coenzyme F420 biosynthesis associated uncharacterized protein n=1 Tax=Nocardioides panaciterrulae TaxID=661492 RepID=A0A7Y9E9G5_9ACTN|nr:coenzyme F420 biosynthesis associated uncharacterized protein [Nocardioides panaciterrulae]